jgi:Chaperone of endosialidase
MQLKQYILKKIKPIIMTTLRLIRSVNRLPLRLGLLLIPLVFVCMGLLPQAQAVTPSPDGGYPGGNTAEGQTALLSLTTGGFNTGVGWFSLKSLTTGSFNTGVGAGTLVLNTADQNTATGAGALLSNTTGDSNTANGAFALVSNTTGFANTANGDLALFNNTSGNVNTAMGAGALQNNITGAGNIALGGGAGSGITTADAVICIGADGADVSNTTWIGNVYGVTTQNGTTAPVIVSADGQLGTMPSSERFKKDIATMEKASETILSLRPVTFHYKSDAKETPQFGLIAEEVAKVNPALVLPDKEGKPYSVRYDQVNAMLLNEFLKEHNAFAEQQRVVQEQEATIMKLKATAAEQEARATNQATAIAHQQKQIEALTAGLQRVSAQIEARRSAPQVVLNNP